MTPLRVARILSSRASGIDLSLGLGWTCRVTMVGEGIGRVLFVPPGGLREPRTWVIGAKAEQESAWNGIDRLQLFPGAQGAISGSPDSPTLTGHGLRVHVALDPFGLTWEQWDGAAWQACCADRGSYAYAAAGRSGALMHWQARDENDQYFGLGDKTGRLDKSGRRMRTRQLDALGYNAEASDPLYKHWPFFLGRRADTGSAYGVYYDTLAECTFDFGQEFDNYHGFFRSTEIADGDLDYYVIAGPDVPSALARYVGTIGGTAMPPRWTLGYANTTMALTDFPDAQVRIAAFLERAKTESFPLSSYHFGSGYSSRGKRRYVFTWNTEKFPDAPALMRSFKEAGVRTVANLKPCLLEDHPAYAGLAEHGGFIRDAADGKPCLDQFWDGWGAHLDFTRDSDRSWWQANLQEQILDVGIDAGWNDNNEYEIWSETGVSCGGGQAIPIHRSRALHALLMTRATATQQAAAKPGERVFTVTRAGPPGIQRFAQTWSGDNTTSWHTVRWNQRMALTMSLSGLFNVGHDIGGFAGPVPDAEMLIRWSQACCLVPRMIMNSWKPDGSVNSPWLHSEATAPIRAAIGLRLHLMPYLYTLMWQASRQHVPVLRPTFFHFADDAACWNENDEMLVGPDLLVAPVFEPGVRQRTLYLPRGKHATGWYDFWSGAYYAGGQTIAVDVPLDRLPLFVRAGALLPATDTWSDSEKTEEASRRLYVFPTLADAGDTEMQTVLFEDDGLQASFSDATCAWLAFSARWRREELELDVTREGAWTLPYTRVRVVRPGGDKRLLALRAEPAVGVTLFEG
ncbi:TIM-barrel domain-containing protein [Propionivibrio soli]|uniref:TIM-barrel domain-containing protein n=1 Tax=Propionivibrio soli TaxID=2976531 RepID=UPI0021E76D55|nr:TIM-barrel domain-containing protein [Propionivibrio soli]